MMPVRIPKKLIEVALPLDDINVACAREKSIRHGHPSTLHLWWARRPLAAARAILFSQLVNDPGYQRELGRGVNKKEAAKERERIFEIIRKLVLWENSNNETILKAAREEIWKSWRETCVLNKTHPDASTLFDPEKLPAFHDPFAGGGALPFEAQRLGLESFASDLNPVAVLINKAMIEIPLRFQGSRPVGPRADDDDNVELLETWTGSAGLAEDVRRYGKQVLREADARIGKLYPRVKITREMAEDRADLRPLIGKEFPVVTWLWARTVKSPNPAFSHVDVPLMSTAWVCSKKGNEAWVEVVKRKDNSGFDFKVRIGGEPATDGTVSRKGGVCSMSGATIDFKHIRAEAKAGRMPPRLMTIVALGPSGRIFLPPTPQAEAAAKEVPKSWKPESAISHWPGRTNVVEYGMTTFGDLFTARQLTALTTFSDLVQEIRGRIRKDAIAAGIADDGRALAEGGASATAYADAIVVYLACVLGRAADFWNSNATWESGGGFIAHAFTRQAIPMVWDFAEANPFSAGTGNWEQTCLDWVARVVESFAPAAPGHAVQADAQSQEISSGKVVSTDPPYYDNIPYADLSDFFYGWQRRTLKPVFPELFATLSVPKMEELVASPYRHGGRLKAESFFLDGMTRAMHGLSEKAHPAFPVTIYYAFKQSESSDDGTGSTGWEAFLQAILSAGFSICGTWPVRTEREARSIGIGSNALASSIVLVCRKRDVSALTVSRREFVRELNAVLPDALDEMTRGGVNSPVAPVDLSQAMIGPGMAIYSKYAAILEADGKPMSMRTALQLINRFLAEDDFDADSRFCLHWFESNGWNEGKFGDADVLARSKGTSVDGVREAGVVKSGAGKVRLLRFTEYPANWKPGQDLRTPVWEALHHLIRALQTGGGESAAGTLLAKMPSRMESIRQLAYRLYTLCERQGWAEDARAYNELITSWQAIEAASQEIGHVGTQRELEI